MSNRGQRPRIYDSENLCLKGSTPEDRKFFSVYRLGEDGDLKNEGDGMLSVWALRARSYKTRAEA